MTNDTGILLTNIGTPDAPTVPAVRRYLKEFLSDPRVVKIPRFIWWPILHGFILRVRPQKSAALYQKIWRETGSPLLIYSRSIAEKLQQQLNMPVALGMHYGNPSIKTGLEQLQQQQVKKIVVLPLYPQYSATTTAVTVDSVTKILNTWRNAPSVSFIHDYASHPNYINAIANSIRIAWGQQKQTQHLLFSFHGIPKSHSNAGDPYAKQCHTTAQLIAEQLQLTHWSVAFQSRLGRAEWLKPYTEKTLKEFPQHGIKSLQVICPGFAVDCLETLEEIAIRGKEQFLTSGGKTFNYIAALNDSDEQIDLLAQLIQQHLHP